MKDILSHTLAEHITALENKAYSAKELTEAYISSIEQNDAELGAYITTDLENALDSAKEADNRRSNGNPLSKIDGIPYALKDNISTRKIRTTCASKMLENYVPPFDASVVHTLKICGAILLGKTNLDEFAMGIDTSTSYFKTTLNPLDRTRVAGGSSGGSAAAVAANEAAFAIGSDTGGSVRQPAAFCGIVGIRPTYGAISRYGLISFAPSLDQIGILSKDILDGALLSNILFAADAKDETSRQHPCTDFCAELGKSVKGMTVALPKCNISSMSEQTAKALNHTVNVLSSLGVSIKEVALPHAESAYAAYYTISCAEASSNLARFDGVRYGHRTEHYESIDELYTKSRSEGFGDEVKRRILFGTMAISDEYKNDFYQNAVKLRSLITSELNQALDGADALLLPTAPSAAYKLGDAPKLGFRAGTDDIFCTLASLVGLPAISLPYKRAGEMPIGIQLVGKAFGESTLYRLGFAMQNLISGGGRND